MSNFYTTSESSSANEFVVAESPRIDSTLNAVVVGCIPGHPGQAALEEAARECHYRGNPSEPAALHVVMYSTDQMTAPGHGEIAEADAVVQSLKQKKIEYRIYRAGTEPAEQLLELVRTVRAELLVISTRRRSPMMKFFLGSVAQQLILDAACPVLTVK